MRYITFLITPPLCIFFACTQTAENKNTTDSHILCDSLFTAGIEGPAVDSNNNLYLVNFQHEGSIAIIKSEDSIPQLFIDLPNSSVGNGIRFDAQNNMYVADYINHNVLKIDLVTKNISVFAHDSCMNQPNDLAIMENGILFASDPNWKNGSGKLWRINKNGGTTLLEDSMGTTNGVEVSPDQKHLYVNESVQRNIWMYDLDTLGNLSNKKIFITFPDGGMDGMRCDKSGNLFVARYDKGLIASISPTGKLLKEFKLFGKKPTNVSFSKDWKKLFVTIQDKKWIEYIVL
jgi:gluconolactonase